MIMKGDRIRHKLRAVESLPSGLALDFIVPMLRKLTLVVRSEIKSSVATQSYWG